MRKFNTAGPCDERRHYMVPPESRLPEARGLVADLGYFVVHAPRQTGKTTTLRSLARSLTAEGKVAALHLSCEAGQAAGDDFGAAEQIILAALRAAAEDDLPAEVRPPADWPPAAPAGACLSEALRTWSRICPRPLVMFFDEVDALRGRSLESVLRQLRSGFPSRPERFPASVVLCGLRDVRDYKAASGGDPSRLGTASPFNIKVESLRIDNFTREQVESLLGQHTDETGRIFEPAALDRVWELTRGQPWLVNALAREVVEKMALDPSEPVHEGHVDEAAERLILARSTHLDSLVARLNEPRVRSVIEPLLSGAFGGEGDTYDDDVQYVRDLGLVSLERPLAVANPIYREVIVRVLAATAEEQVPVHDPGAFVLPDGRLDLDRLLSEFAAFWREHGDVLASRMTYHEVAPQLVLMAFLQRVVNGGGYVDREYGVGRGRIDLLVRWPYEADGTRRWQREALELKVRADGQADPLSRGLEQLDGYLDRLGLDTGILVIFDRRAAAPPIAERTVFEDAVTPSGKTITVLRA